MSLNIELVLLTTMLYRGDFSPLSGGVISRDDLMTSDAQAICDFILTYKEDTSGVARYPSLAVVRNRFSVSQIPLPEPEPGANLDSLIHEVKLQSFRARLREASTSLDILAQSPNPLEGLSPVLKALRDGQRDLVAGKHESIGGSIQEIVEQYKTGNLLSDGMPWAWPSLTLATRGMHRKEYIVLAGRPKARKTFIAIQQCTYSLMHSNARILVLTPEMPPRQMMLRIISSMAGIRYQEFKDGALSPAEEERLMAVADMYGKFNDESDDHYEFRLRDTFHLDPNLPCPSIDIVQSTGRTNEWIASQIEYYQPDIVFMDSLYRHGGDGRANHTETSRTAVISRGCKEMAMEYNVIFFTTHQINRDGEHKVGTLGNIALSDAVSQDLDLGLRAITGEIEGVDHTALVLMGARETKMRGVLIRNAPYVDMSEVAPLENMKIVEHLLNQEAESDKAAKRASKTANMPAGHKAATKGARSQADLIHPEPGWKKRIRQEADAEAAAAETKGDGVGT